MKFNFSFYVVGFILAVGVVFGRFICGWICPFGLIQEILHKIPSPKFRLPRLCKLLKYVVLVIFVIMLPLVATNFMGMGKPAFCQFICPAGTLEGGLTLLASHPELRAALGKLFTLKTLILVVTLVGCVLVQRFFCKLLCPLGAIYGLLNKISFLRLNTDKSKCVVCGACARACPMDVDPTLHPDSTECIRCGKCAAVCPTKAISLSFIHKNPAAENVKTEITERQKNLHT